jgi:alkylation response protein AidB-like acyl-CoA dehydrogenase
MDFSFTPEQDDLRQTVRKFLDAKSDEQTVRRLMTSELGYDREVWAQLADQLGLAGLIVPETFNGAGLGFVDLAVVLEEMGRALLCAPYLSTAVLATNALLHCASPAAQSALLPGIASGQRIATLAFAEPHRGWDLAGVTMRAVREDDVWQLDGVKTYVLDGQSADVLLVVAKAGDGLSLFRVDADTDGLERTLLPTLDLTRKLAQLTFAATPAERIGTEGDLTHALDKVLELGVVALAAEQVGGAQRCLELSTEYAKTRLQFGRPIGSYQAIKHRCADMLVAVEFAKSAAYFAAFRAADGDDAELAAAASMAKSYCSEAYFQAAADTIQIHGGMGFTWEHPAHLYFKRAKSSSLLFGDPLHHREKLAKRIGI